MSQRNGSGNMPPNWDFVSPSDDEIKLLPAISNHYDLFSVNRR